MSDRLYFYCGIRPLGSVGFRVGALFALKRLYGVDWFDCVSYDQRGVEVIGGREEDDENDIDTVPFTPDWDRGLARARDLLACVRAQEERGWLPGVEKLVGLLEQCATSSLREFCRVRHVG